LAFADDAIGEPERERLFGADGAAGEDEVHRPAFGDEARQPRGGGGGERNAEAAAEDAKGRRRRGDAQVAPDGELEPAGDGVALDGSDYRLGQLEPARPHRPV